ncbi:hypothetical protein GCM10022284_29100 [Streptomyces hundungensis]|nr:hypothetical protein [Streptomyces sp. MAG02]
MVEQYVHEVSASAGSGWGIDRDNGWDNGWDMQQGPAPRTAVRGASGRAAQ